VVGLCLDRADMVAGILAVWLAGAAYLPLDREYPAERLAFMLADARVPWVLTDERWRAALAGQNGGFQILEVADIAAVAPVDGAASAAPDNRAYVLYTSGSTGQPKGVEVSRRNLANFLAAMAHRPGFGAADVLVSVTTISFDIAALEIYLPLLAGGRLELASREVAADGDRLAELLARSGATVLQATPATWRLLLAAGWRNPSRLRMLCGGEALPADLAGELLRRGAALWNLYGPTETTVWSAVERVGAGPISLGRPIDNTVLRLLDRSLAPVPVGVVGQLYIGGRGVARGYRGRPDWTADRFLPDSWGEAPGERLYRTGDLARWRADGGLEFLGRSDHQVKVRGLRIELPEIEVALREPAWVAAAVAALRPLPAGDQRLVAYVVCRADGVGVPADWTEALRSALRRRLPGYMVPAAFVRLADLPLTTNGKVDRKALPLFDSAGAEARPRVLAAPQSAVEQAIAEIWREVLGVAEVGVEENFFDLGGHSLLLIEVRQRLRRLVGRTLPLVDLFRHASVRSLAAFLEAADRAGVAAQSGVERSQARQSLEDLRRAARSRRREAKAL
jgi:amino acid adenylation domain-containing protein